MAAPLVPALFSTGRKASIALTADAPLNVGLFGEELEGWLVGIFATTTPKAKDEVEGGVLLDGVVLEGVAVLELLASEDQTLLIGWDSFLVLNLGLDVLDSVGWLNLEGDMFASEGLDEDLHWKGQAKPLKL